MVLKMVQKPAQQDSLRSNGVSDIASPYLGSAPDHSMTFDVKDIADVSVANVSTTDIIVKESNGMHICSPGGITSKRSARLLTPTVLQAPRPASEPTPTSRAILPSANGPCSAGNHQPTPT